MSLILSLVLTREDASPSLIKLWSQVLRCLDRSDWWNQSVWIFTSASGGAAEEPLKDRVFCSSVWLMCCSYPSSSWSLGLLLPLLSASLLSFGHSVTSATVEPNGFDRGVKSWWSEEDDGPTPRRRVASVFHYWRRTDPDKKQEVRSLWLPPGNASVECQRSVMT